MSTEITKTGSAQVATKNDIKSLLSGDAFKSAISQILPKHLTAERMARVAIACLTKVPKLADCTPESFFGCMMSLSQLGLEPDGRRAHLIPYGNTCTLIIDYKGLVDLIMRTGNVSSVHADIVSDNDIFAYNCGDIEKHVIDFKQERGNMYAVYCIIQFKDGTKKTEVMSKLEVDKIKARSRAGSSGPWVSDYNEMAKKTVFKRCSKWVQLSAEVIDAIGHEDVFEMQVHEATKKRVQAGDFFKGMNAKVITEATEATIDATVDKQEGTAQDGN